MAEQQSENPQTQPSPASKSVDLNVGGNIGGNAVIGDHNYVVNNYYPVIEKNVEKHEPDFWALKHPYPMPPNFTGRVAERAILTHWLKEDSENHLFVLRALGGFGKSALAWQWLTHDVDIKEYPKVLWWSFYEGDASFEHFIEETLKYLNHKVPESKREQVDELLNVLQSQKVLLIMDGFERLLRAYGNMNASHQGDEDKAHEGADCDCVNLNTEHFLKSICSMPNIMSKALMTTRLTPRALEKFGQFIQGCRDEELKAMDKDDAIAFFRVQGVHKGTNHEIEDTCRLYGFHPLSLRLLVGHIMTDFKNPGDIVVAQKLKVSGDVAKHQNHILEVSYNRLPALQQKLLSTIACFRSSTKLDSLEFIAENNEALENDLHDLMERGLLQFDRKNDVFDLHPIVRRYTYDRLTENDKKGAHERLVNYFEAVPKTETVKTLEDLASVIELYHHMVKAGNLDEAWKILRDRLVPNPLHYQFGAYQLMIELKRALFPDGEDKPPRLKREDAQAWTLNALANSYSLSGQPRRAVPLFEKKNELREKMGDKKNLVSGLGNVATQQLVIGALSAAERNLRRAIELDKELKSEYDEACDRQELGCVLSYRGQWNESDEVLSKGLELAIKVNHAQTQGVIWSYRTLFFLLLARANHQSKIVNLKSSIECAQRALELADEDTKQRYTHPRDYVRAYWLLGAAYCANTDLTLAEENLSKALNLCRQINSVDAEADILLDIARLRYAQGDFKDAQEKASEALMITERSGFVLQGADVNLFLATLAVKGYKLESDKDLSDKEAALLHAKRAKELATCDGPPYYYKVAYEEAEKMLERLKDEL